LFRQTDGNLSLSIFFHRSLVTIICAIVSLRGNNVEFRPERTFHCVLVLEPLREDIHCVEVALVQQGICPAENIIRRENQSAGGGGGIIGDGRDSHGDRVDACNVT
jgi:hypothetical protein